MYSELANTAGLVLVTASLVFAGIQTRELARQRRLSNGVARTTAVLEINALTRAWYDPLLERPELRPYFYDRQECPPDNPHRARVVVISELLADVIECNLRMVETMPGDKYYESWHHWPGEMLTMSPILRETVGTYPRWWPALALLCDSINANGPELRLSEPHPLLRKPERRL
jgi:hypothetical protein